MPVARLEAIKSNLKYSFAASLDNAQSIGATLASFVHFERTPATIDQLYRTYDALTPEDLVTYAQKYLTDQGRALATLSNGDSLPGVAEAFTVVTDVARAAARGVGERPRSADPDQPDQPDERHVQRITLSS